MNARRRPKSKARYSARDLITVDACFAKFCRRCAAMFLFNVETTWRFRPGPHRERYPKVSKHLQ